MRTHTPPTRRAVLAAVALAALAFGITTIPLADGDEPAPKPSVPLIAVVDAYQLADDLMASDRYTPARVAREQTIKDELKPLEDELSSAEKQLQGKNPQEEAAQAEFREFQGRVQAYQRLRQQRQAEFTAFVAKQYVEAYELARASSAAVAESLGFQYVLAARGKDKPITTDNPERLIEALLGRPVLLAPENADITADVRKDLKLE